jgi:hypothetical protein
MLDHIAAWSSIIGALIGFPALVYSMLAFSEAKRAKNASERTEDRVNQVRAALKTLTTAEQLHQLSLRASELLLFIESGRYHTAHYVARELRFDLNSAIVRWDALDEPSRLRLTVTSGQLKEITEFLREKGELSAQQQARVFEQCDDVANALRLETGKIQTIIERPSVYE